MLAAKRFPAVKHAYIPLFFVNNASFHVVIQLEMVQIQYFAHHCLAAYRERAFYTFIQVAAHPVGRPEVHGFLPIGIEVV